jgi:hypothetical protein
VITDHCGDKSHGGKAELPAKKAKKGKKGKR